MAWYKNLFGNKKKDFGSTTTTGGLELIARLTANSMSKTALLEQYGKSLYVFTCINKIAQKTASIDLHLYKITSSKGDTKEIFTHPALDLFYKINPFQTKTEFLETTIINLKCTGEAFWFKVRNDRGQVVELWNLRPDMMTIMADPINFIRGYEFQKNDGSTVKFMPDEIVHIKYPDPLNQYTGIGPLAVAQNRVQTEEFATEWQRDFFLNSARPDALIKNPNSGLTKEQKEDIKDGWNKNHRGRNNSSKLAILEGGLEYQLISISQKEMDYIESLKFTRDDIFVAFGTPKSVVAVTDDVNRANAETGMYIFLSETIKPEMMRLVEKMNEQIIYPDFDETLYIDFDDPTPANRDLQLREYSEGIQNNYLLINEVRAKEGLAPVRGGWSFYMPLMNTPMGGISSTDQKDLFKKIDDQSKANEKAINGFKKVKLYDFKGRFWLKQKIELYEAAEKSVKDALSGKKKKEKGWVPMITDPGMKLAYANMINKKIDEEGAKLKEGANVFFERQKERVLANLAKQKSKAARQKMNASDLLDVSEEGALSAEFVIPYIEQYLRESGQEALAMLAPQEDFTTSAKIQALIKKRAQLFADSVTGTTLDNLQGTLAEGIAAGEGIRDLSNRVEAVYSDFPAYRSELIARTEATVANNEGALEGYRQSEVATGKEWINAGDGRVREEHMDSPVGVGGEIVGLDDNFSNGLPYPEEPNCRCVLGPAFLE